MGRFLASILLVVCSCDCDDGPRGPTSCPETAPIVGDSCGREGLSCRYEVGFCATAPSLARSSVACVDSGDGFFLWQDTGRTFCPDGGSDAGPTPDAGGLDAAMSDAGGLDAAGTDAGPLECSGTMMSDLPGVRIVFAEQPCTFTLAEAAAGIDVAYDVVIDTALMGVTDVPQDAGGCGAPGDSGLILFEDLGGGSERWCLCDTGLCPGTEPTVDLVAGTYRSTFHWTGLNWGGPSDTGMPMGAPFPAGSYQLTVSAIGRYLGADYRVEATYPIGLTP